MKNYRKLLFVSFLISFVFVIVMSGCKKDKDDDDIQIPVNVVDADGNVYNTIKIGDQVWLKENLKATKYRNGSSIPFITDNTEWGTLSTPGFSWYGNSQSTYGNNYGALYNWYAVKTGNICPEGWHVPSDAEWTTLVTYLGGDTEAGGKLKATTLWTAPNTGATNESNFTAFPGGYRFLDGESYSITEYGYWWSSTEFNSNDGYYRLLYYDSKVVNKGNFSKKYGFSVRCMMD
jgi:uncharacterized protein (TIGR02145 family)